MRASEYSAFSPAREPPSISPTSSYTASTSGPSSRDREGDDQPAGHVQPLGARRRVEQPELLAPAPGHHGIQALEHGLGAEVGGDLGAAERVAVVGDLGHRSKADRAGRERSAQQRRGLSVGAGGQLEAAAGVLHGESPVVVVA